MEKIFLKILAVNENRRFSQKYIIKRASSRLSKNIPLVI
jgi:hypothetical protein